MKQYLLSVHNESDGEPWSPEEMQRSRDQVAVFNDELQNAGVWVFAGGLYPPSTATVVRAVPDGDSLITDGPFAESKEYIGGFWVIKVADLDAALDWAARGSQACGLAVEVRPFQEETQD
jgi:hypothetical protein